MKVLLASLLCCFCTIPVFSQRRDNPGVKTYAVGKSMGTLSLRIQPTSPWKPVFYLTTSWIPGKEHRGYFRYKLPVSLTYVPDSNSTAESMKQAFADIQSCFLILELYDDGGFVLQKIPLFFQQTVDDTDTLIGLLANDSSQMDLSDYKQFIGAGSWNISWTCPEK